MSQRKMFLVIAALAAPTTAHAAPTYCKQPGMDRVLVEGGFEMVLEPDPRTALPQIIGGICNPSDDVKARAKELEAVRAKWSQRLDLTESDWADIADWALEPQGHRVQLGLKAEKQALSAMDAVDQYATITATKYNAGDALYLIDALSTRPTEAGRFAYIQLCLASARPVEWALCQADIAALDPKKLSAEIRANKSRPGHERASLRIALELARPKLAERAKAVKELTAKEPGYAKLFALAEAARKSYKPDPKLRELALAMDDAMALDRTSAFEGCDDKTRAAFAAAVGAIPAARFADLKDVPESPFGHGAATVIANDPNGYLAATALQFCQSQKLGPVAAHMADAMERWPGFRGPRNAALTAMVAANVTLDDRSARIEWPGIRRFPKKGITGGVRGTVAAVKVSGATTTIEFAKKLRKESICTDWKDTNKVVQIRADGTVVYDYICLKRGTFTVNTAPGPQKVDSRSTANVKPGVTVRITGDAVAGVWKSGAPIAVFGVPVK
jgi:hypothetical protein